MKEKSGQIAHLDRNNSNASLENLAFLCFDHHDQYDSRNSQGKGFTIGEVKRYRGELRNLIDRFINEQIVIGDVKLKDRDPYAGHYVRVDAESTGSTKIDITALPDTPDGTLRYFVSGLAIVNVGSALGARTGELGSTFELHDGKLCCSTNESIQPHSITIEFSGDGFELTDSNPVGNYGFGVSFDGFYVKSDENDYSE